MSQAHQQRVQLRYSAEYHAPTVRRVHSANGHTVGHDHGCSEQENQGSS